MPELEPVEVLDSPESVPASEVFASNDEFTAAVETALEDGTAVIEVAEGTEGAPAADIYPYISLEESDIDTTALSDSDQRWGISGGREDAFVFKNKSDIEARLKDQIHEKTVYAVGRDNEWHFDEPAIEQDIKDGQVRQLFEITFGDSDIRIPLVNFSDTKLSEDQLAQVQQVLERVATATNGASLAATRAICIQKPDRFRGDHIAGSTRLMSRVIRLNEKLINGDFDSELTKFSEFGLNPLESTLTHEQGHLVEGQDTEPTTTFAASTGWSNRTANVVDDYGHVKFASRWYLDYPFEVKVSDEEGKLVDAIARDEFGSEVVDKAKPVTGYGATNAGEDLAESFVPFVYADPNDTESLDSIRRNAIGGIVKRAARAHGVELEEFDSQTEDVLGKRRYGFDIAPKTYYVAEPKYSYNPKPKARTNKPPDDGYREGTSRVVDDYGNLTEARGRREPKSGYEF